MGVFSFVTPKKMIFNGKEMNTNSLIAIKYVFLEKINTFYKCKVYSNIESNDW